MQTYTLATPTLKRGGGGFSLKWIGKNYARLASSFAPTTSIKSDAQHNQKAENKNSQNLFFTGDNLEVLRHLQNAYTSKVDVIYIDPPYNRSAI